MKTFKKIFVYLAFILLGLFSAKRAQAQLFWIGVDGNAVYSWFASPKLDEAAGEKNVITYDGWGWNLGAFVRYGKRPFVLVGLSWTRTYSKFAINDPGDELNISESIKLNNFDFAVKIGYEVLQMPMFKADVHGGLFIGRSLLFSGESIYFENSDFVKPQWGITGGIGFQFTNLIFGVDYSYHFSELFKPVDINGTPYQIGSKIQMVALKVGFMF